MIQVTADEDALVPEDRPIPKINIDPDVWGDLERRFENVLEIGSLTMFAVPEDAKVQHLGGRFYTVTRKAANRKETDVDDKDKDNEQPDQETIRPAFTRADGLTFEERREKLKATLESMVQSAKALKEPLRRLRNPPSPPQ
jgi:hypothetical protein